MAGNTEVSAASCNFYTIGLHLLHIIVLAHTLKDLGRGDPRWSSFESRSEICILSSGPRKRGKENVGRRRRGLLGFQRYKPEGVYIGLHEES